MHFFLGAAAHRQRNGWLCQSAQHVRHFGELTAPFHEMRNMKSKFIEWTPALLERFEAVKTAIQNAPCLALLISRVLSSWRLTPLTLVLAVCSISPPVTKTPISRRTISAIFSRKLKAAQQRYPAYKKELLALVMCLRRFHSYIWGREDTVVITDHKPLTYIHSQSELSPALQQWLMSCLIISCNLFTGLACFTSRRTRSRACIRRHTHHRLAGA